jgi:hypothetical protein
VRFVTEIWREFGDQPSARLIVNTALLAALVAVGFYLIGRIRGRYRESDVRTGILLDNFRELHSGGQLSDEEYRNIKSKLAARLRDELNQSEKAE